MTTNLYDNPRQLFVIDGLGAVLSAVLLSVVLVAMEPTFGIPPAALYVLAFFPCVFACYDFYAYRQVGAAAPHLRRVALLNGGYCCLSLALAAWHDSTVTLWGWGYILGEVAIVAALARVEWRVANFAG